MCIFFTANKILGARVPSRGGSTFLFSRNQGILLGAGSMGHEEASLGVKWKT